MLCFRRCQYNFSASEQQAAVACRSKVVVTAKSREIRRHPISSNAVGLLFFSSWPRTAYMRLSILLPMRLGSRSHTSLCMMQNWPQKGARTCSSLQVLVVLLLAVARKIESIFYMLVLVITHVLATSCLQKYAPLRLRAAIRLLPGLN